jgi:CP12 domain
MTNSQETTMTLDERIEQAREAAHQAGETAELHQEAGHKRSAKPQNSLERFCDDNPDAQECLLYDT